MKTEQVVEALKARHPNDTGDWASFVEAFGYIDFFAFMLIRTHKDYVKGERLAYEIKVSRSDLRSELNDTKKRIRALKRSHRMYFAIPHDLLSVEERAPGGRQKQGGLYIPEECGIVLVFDDGRSFKLREAPRREVHPLPEEDVLWIARDRGSPKELRHHAEEHRRLRGVNENLRREIAALTQGEDHGRQA